jgi:hypothetical protein
LKLRRSIPLCVMNKISEMFIPSNTTYVILKVKLGYMFRPCGVIIRPLQFDEAVRHKQDNEQWTASSNFKGLMMYPSLTLSQLMLHICGVSKTFGEWYQKTNKTEDRNKLTLFVSSVLLVFWYHSPNVLDTPHICNISWLRVKISLIILLYY